MPAATHSSTMYWIIGLSTTGNISLGIAFVAGNIRVPKPATGITAFVILRVILILYFIELHGHRLILTYISNNVIRNRRLAHDSSFIFVFQTKLGIN